MADSAAERTEQPTPERLRKAREQGRIPQSQELASALLLAAVLAAAAIASGALWQHLLREVQEGLSLRLAGPLDIPAVAHLLKEKAISAFLAMAPFLGAAAVGGLLGSVLVGGWTFAPAALAPEFGRMSPSYGLQTLFAPRSAVNLAASLVKLAVIATIMWTYLRDKLPVCLALESAQPVAALAVSLELVFGLLWRITAALLAIGLADAIYQRWQYRRDLRMTRDEVKEERRSHEPAPMVRSRVRSLHLALVRKRMLRKVPEADVVIANPTHVAVALKYDAAAMDAPQIVAKGAELLCEKIKDIARRHGVPVVERPELARALYDSAEVGQTIPEALYVAVAEILAMIYRMRKQRA
ncbi:MAG: EscU/YscU/HrcU family type III secretion system export apparatus switch protein [Planctomycetes bacterium]|nr:EscU/YscU/HrcU family type III secretion system export apparatus switch protein [Planctomycetota bacterium]